MCAPHIRIDNFRWLRQFLTNTQHTHTPIQNRDISTKQKPLRAYSKDNEHKTTAHIQNIPTEFSIAMKFARKFNAQAMERREKTDEKRIAKQEPNNKESKMPATFWLVRTEAAKIE